MKKLLIIAGIGIGSFAIFGAAKQKITRSQLFEVYTRTLISIEQFYIEKEDPNKLIENSIRGMVEKLDPFSEFFTPEENQEFSIRTKGKFGGLGIQISMKNGWLTVIAPIEGTPAYKAGILAGDRIIKIEGKSTRGMKLKDVVKLLRGKPGTKVHITIKRPGVDEPLEFTITRAVIEIHTVPFFTKLDGDIGYVRLTSFSENAYPELKTAIDSLLKLGCKKLILDLRSNPGGLLSEALKVSNLFLPRGSIIVSTRGRTEGTDTTFRAIQNNEFPIDYPLVVLVNRGSASASEIVSGALQDWDRALILGDTTFGKGSVQRIYPVGYGYVVKLTVAKYYTPSGRCIHREKLFGTETDTLGEDTLGNVRPVYHTLKLHRSVYGGGGIIPDVVHVVKPPPKLISEALAKGVFFDFAVKYRNEHPDIKDLNFVLEDKNLLPEFEKFLREKGVKFTEVDFEDAAKDIRKWLIPEIFEKYKGIKGRYQAALNEDEVVNHAVRLLETAKTQEDLFSEVGIVKER